MELKLRGDDCRIFIERYRNNKPAIQIWDKLGPRVMATVNLPNPHATTNNQVVIRSSELFASLIEAGIVTFTGRTLALKHNEVGYVCCLKEQRRR